MAELGRRLRQPRKRKALKSFRFSSTPWPGLGSSLRARVFSSCVQKMWARPSSQDDECSYSRTLERRCTTDDEG
eukprot:7391806-Prymnesium_polylepis.2